MNKLNLIFTFICVLLFVFDAKALVYEITGNDTWSGEQNFSGNGSGTDGIYSDSASGVITADSNIISNANGFGVKITGGAKVTINNTSSDKVLETSNNIKGSSTDSSGINVSGAGSVLNINNMNIKTTDNPFFGIYGNNNGVININGSQSGLNKISISGHVSSVGSSTGIRCESSGSIVIKNMSVDILSNRYGIYAASGTLNIEGVSSGLNTLTVNNNSRLGIGATTADVFIKNMDVYVAGNDAYGILSQTGATVEISGSSVKTNTLSASNTVNGSGITVSVASIKITDMDVILDGNKNRGVAVGTGVFTVIGSANRNNMSLRNNASGVAIASSGLTSLVSISNMNVEVEGNDFSNLRTGASFNMTNSDVHILDNSKGFITDNDAVIDLQDSVIRGTDIFIDAGKSSLDASNNVQVNLNNSSIEGGMAGVADLNINVTLGNSSQWNTKLDSSINSLNITNSSVNLKNSAAGTYNSLVINSLNTTDGNFYLNTYFNGDGVNTDKIVIKNDSSGNATLFITSTGYDEVETQGDGILVVDQSSVSSSNANADFRLLGGVVDSGFMEYELYKGDAGSAGNNWYLRSNGHRSNVANLIANVPAVNIHIVQTGMNELRKRMGELRNNDPMHKSGVWARTYTRHLKIDESVNSSMNLFGFEAGYDYQFYGDCDNKFYAGLMAGYSYTDNIKTNNNRGTKGSGHANTPTIGAYGTWMNSGGWFADATLRGFWTNMDMTSYTAQNVPITFDIDRQFTATSIEVGRTLQHDIDKHSKWVFEPKVELGYIYGRADSFNTKNASVNNKIKYENTESIQARGALMTGYDRVLENGSAIMPFMQVAVIQEFGGVTNINFAGNDYKSDISGTSYEIGTGINAKINNNMSVYGGVAHEFGNIINSLSANFGIRYNF